MNSPNPALVTQGGAGTLPRMALFAFCAAYLLPGLFGRDPWRSADMAAFGVMASIAEGRSAWLAPTLGGVPVEGGLLPHWLGAIFIALLHPWVEPALAARIPFALLLLGALACTWFATFQLARTESAQPLPFAFGGEADTLSYARAMADAALLAMMASLGLLQLGHETTPELLQLFGASLVLWALAAAPYRGWRANAAAMAGLVLMAGSSAPVMAVTLGLAGALVLARSAYGRARAHAAWLAAGAALAAVAGTLFNAWAWRFELQATATQAWQLLRLLAWFCWPLWPLAVWTLWRWRRQLARRHIAVPLVSALTALLACVWMGGSDRALMLGLPGLAVLAAFALPTFKRSTAAAIDWFSMCFFTVCALAIWVIYSAMHTGVPAKPAANVAKLAVGYVPHSSAWALGLGFAATMAWIWLLRWRTSRSPQALWKSLVIPAGGVALCWLLLMTLWLPLLDFARSMRPWAERVRPHLQGVSCISAPGLGAAQVAALEYHLRAQVDALSVHPSCPVLLHVVRQSTAPEPPAGWQALAQVRRPTERNELTLLYRRP